MFGAIAAEIGQGCEIHQLLIKLEMEVFFPVTEAVEIGKYADGFFFRERNDRVLVERNDAYAQQHMTVDRDGGLMR